MSFEFEQAGIVAVRKVEVDLYSSLVGVNLLGRDGFNLKVEQVESN